MCDTLETTFYVTLQWW